MNRSIVLAVTRGLSFVANAQAASIGIGFEGVVTGFRTDNPLQTPLVGFAVGQPVLGYFVFDDATPTVTSYYESRVGDYFASNSGSGIIEIGDNPTRDVFQVRESNNIGLSGPLNGPNYILQSNLEFEDLTGTALNGITIARPFDMATFANQNCFLNFFGPAAVNPLDTGNEVVQFEVTRMAYGRIPEPSSVALAALSFIGLVAWGWRQRR